MDIDVTVTKADIRAGRQLNPGACPLALAIKRAVPQASFVNVSGDSCWLQMPNGKDYWKSYSLVLPRQAQDFVLRFDFYGRRLGWLFGVRPFTFALEGL